MTDWYETLSGLYVQMWDTLAIGVKDAQHPARRPCLATLSPDGWPEARTVVLRSADAAAGYVTAHTDLYSDKIESLRQTPRAAFHIWAAEKSLQIRLQAEVAIVSGQAILPLWQQIPDHAQQSYGVTPPPGQRIATALAYKKEPDPASFAVLECRIMRVDLVHLGDDHRRAVFERSDAWRGQWLSP